MVGRIARHPFIAASLATCVAIGTTLLIGELAGLHQVGRAWNHIVPGWVAVAVATQLVCVPAYVLAYRAIVSETTGAHLRRGLTAELVLVGFGPFAVAGGFSSDHDRLQQIGLEQPVAVRTVLDLGGLEFLSLVWLAFLAALAAVLDGATTPGSFTWPWIVLVPIGTAIAAWIDHRHRAEDVSDAHLYLRRVMESLADVLGLGRHPLRARASWTGILVYWVADMATLYACVRAFGLRPSWESLIVAYGTGYLLSRRTLPLGGAGLVELLLTFSLYWVHQPLAPALAAVVLYRIVTVTLAGLPAFLARFRLEAGEELEHALEHQPGEAP